MIMGVIVNPIPKPIPPDEENPEQKGGDDDG